MPTPLRRLALPLAALLGFALGACKEDDPDDEIDATCAAYCERSVQCNPATIDLDFCTDYCVSVLQECSADNFDAALAGYDECATEVCDALLQCSFDAENEC